MAELFLDGNNLTGPLPDAWGAQAQTNLWAGLVELHLGHNLGLTGDALLAQD